MEIVDTFKNRLNLAIKIFGLKQVDIVKKTGIDKTLLNKYISGNSNASQKKISLLANFFNVNPLWLMGYNVPLQKDLTPKNNISAEYGLLTNDTISVQGLDDDDIKEIKRQIEYLKNKNNNTQK